MKKLMIIPVLALVAACDSTEKTPTNVSIMGVDCEVVATGEQGDMLAKCPTDGAFEPILAQGTTAMFLTAGKDDVDLAAMTADVEHVYVNLVDGDCGENTIGYRFMTQNAVVDGSAMYAVVVCENK